MPYSIGKMVFTTHKSIAAMATGVVWLVADAKTSALTLPFNAPSATGITGSKVTHI